MNKRFLIAWGVVFVVWMAGSFVVQPMPAAMALQQAIYDSVLVIILGIVVAVLSKPSAAED